MRGIKESPPLKLIYVVSINFNSLKGSIKLDLMVETLFVKKCLQFLRVSPTTHLVMTQDTWQDMRSQLTLMTITSHTNVTNSQVRISTTTHPLKWCNYFTYKVVLFITPWVLDILWARSTWNAPLDLRNMTVVKQTHTEIGILQPAGHLDDGSVHVVGSQLPGNFVWVRHPMRLRPKPRTKELVGFVVDIVGAWCCNRLYHIVKTSKNIIIIGNL